MSLEGTQFSHGPTRLPGDKCTGCCAVCLRPALFSEVEFPRFYPASSCAALLMS